MQIVKQELEEYNPMTKTGLEIESLWRSRVVKESPRLSSSNQESIVKWLLGEDTDRFERISTNQLAIAKQAMDYRYRILLQRYLNAGPTQAYRNLIGRLGSLIVLRNKIKTWVALSRDRQRAVADVIQEVIQEMLNSDRYIQHQIAWIAQCTDNSRLRDSLLLTTVEEYCLRPIRNQPLLVYRFVNYLRRSQRGGMTQVPQGEMVRLISEELTVDELDSPVSLLDNQALADYQDEQDLEEQQILRVMVETEFEAYLSENVGVIAVRWLKLYLQGLSQDAIAKNLDLPVKQIYRLREKVSYHAIRVFALKTKPELVANWLEISLQEHNLGLTLPEWEKFYQGLTPLQQKIIDKLKLGESIDAIALDLNWKTHQVMSEWSKIYLEAQSLRT
ncbi:MAG: HetZ-related protein 2 [Oscillatoria sp. PMC 1068.18]|nr:HetZ-related protein 2 [Oscillatoria sp. PMC 1076.18]MEC4989088.1 HetZ-related protein 2 [Oscillatoria sp. PMC 1068.18]